MSVRLNRIKSRNSQFSISIMNFKTRSKPGKFVSHANVSGIICVLSQKNKVVEKIGSIHPFTNEHLLIYLNFPKIAYYLSIGVNFRIVHRESKLIIYHLSRVLFFFFSKKNVS